MDGPFMNCQNGQQGLVDNKEMSVDVCIKSARQFSALKFYFVITHSQLSLIGRCEIVPLSKDSCFVSHFTFPISHPWCNECQYVWLLFQRKTAVLRRIFGLPQNNILQNPCMTLIRNIGQNQSLHCLALFWNF